MCVCVCVRACTYLGRAWGRLVTRVSPASTAGVSLVDFGRSHEVLGRTLNPQGRSFVDYCGVGAVKMGGERILSNQ